jgi:hypothetical protein
VAPAGKFANLIEMLPGVFLALEALDFLRFGFFEFAHVVSLVDSKEPLPKAGATKAKFVPKKRKAHVA